MKRLFMLSAVVLALSAGVSAQTPDQNIVRLTYAKAMYAYQVGALEQGKNLNQKLEFTLSDFHSGNITNNSKPLNTIITNPEGHRLLVLTDSKQRYKVGDNPEVLEMSLTASWKAASLPEDSSGKLGWDSPISTLALDSPWAERFITYEVTASFAGVKEVYRALFLFGQDGKCAPLDTITSNLPWATSLQQLYPVGLLHVLRDNAGVVDWLKANQISTTSCKRGQVCCDLATMRCGILPADLTRELQAPSTPLSGGGIDPNTTCSPESCPSQCSSYNENFGDGALDIRAATQEHAWGDHDYSVNWYYGCTYTNSGIPDGQNVYHCMGHLTMNAISSNAEDTGYVPVMFHNMKIPKVHPIVPAVSLLSLVKWQELAR